MVNDPGVVPPSPSPPAVPGMARFSALATRSDSRKLNEKSSLFSSNDSNPGDFSFVSLMIHSSFAMDQMQTNMPQNEN